MSFAEESLPKTVQEAVDHLIADLRYEEKELIQNTDEVDLIQYYFTLGIGIRNEFGLWSGNKELLKSCCSQNKRAVLKFCGSETIAPDDASMVIIEALWRRLRGSK